MKGSEQGGSVVGEEVTGQENGTGIDISSD